MSMSRRIFAALLPQAVVVGPVVAKQLIEPTSPVPQEAWNVSKGYLSDELVRAGRDLVAPPAYKQYRAAQEVLDRIRGYKYERKRLNRQASEIDFDIMSLKSISKQHKILMQQKRDLEEQKNERTYLDSLIDELGLREFMKKRQELYGDGPETEAGYN